MARNSPRFAFIGFGEAGPLIARGLLDAGAASVAAYDILMDDPARRDGWADRAAAVPATPCASPAEAVSEADLVLSTVTSERALEAATAAAPHLRAGQLYLDLNSCSPAKKVKASAVKELVVLLLALSFLSLNSSERHLGVSPWYDYQCTPQIYPRLGVHSNRRY